MNLYVQDDEEAGIIEQLRSQVCENLVMYAQKYDEEFAPHLPRFVDDIWNLLMALNAQTKYDIVSGTSFILYHMCSLFIYVR